MFLRGILVQAVIATAAVGLAMTVSAAAATLTVTSTANDGPGSLRQAIIDAGPNDVIDFAVSGTITITNQLFVPVDLTIAGPGASVLTISGNNATRVFRTTGNVTITGLAIRNGKAYGNDGGGGINNSGTLVLRDCALLNNTCPDKVDPWYTQYGLGGGMLNTGNATLEGCTVSSNFATRGGAFYNGSTASGGGGSARLTLRDCTLQGNRAQLLGAAIDNRDKVVISRSKLSNSMTLDSTWDGGTIYNYGTAIVEDSEIRNNSGSSMYFAGIANIAYLEMTRCTMAGNSGTSGGAIWNGGIARLTNCTLSSNSTRLNETAGGIDASAVWRNVLTTITNCTIANNVNTAASSASAVFCGVYTAGLKSVVYMRNTIVTKQDPSPSLFVLRTFPGATIVSEGYNLASDTPSVLNQPTDLTNKDPLLLSLQANGGPVMTRALQPGSPAADAGALALFPGTDARGFPRPGDGDENGTGRSDIGAFERASVSAFPTARPVPADGVVPTGAILSGMVNPNSATYTARMRFEWGPDTEYGSASAEHDMGSGQAEVPCTYPLTGLTPGATYHYRVVAANDAGVTPSADESFATPNPGPGTAISFEPTGRYVELPEINDLGGNITIEAWVYPRSHTNMARLIELGNASDSDTITFSLSDGVTGRPWVQVFSNASSAGKVLATGILPLNQWTHLACVVSGANATIFINGMAHGSGVTSALRSVIRRANTIGWYNPGEWSVGFPDALIDDVRIWNAARTAEQIAADSTRRLSGREEGLVCLYRFDEGAGSVVHDAGPSGLDGTLIGPPAWVPSSAPITSDVVPLTWIDVRRALAINAGTVSAAPEEIARYNVVPADPGIGTLDCLSLSRKAAGLDPYP